MRTFAWAVVLLTALGVWGCDKGGDGGDGSGSGAGAEGADEGSSEGQVEEAAANGTEGSGEPNQDAPEAGDAAAVARGDYLVNALAGCPDCHSPRDEMGMLIEDQQLSGNQCLFDMVPPADNGEGCIAVPNITNDATGIANRTDEQLLATLRTGHKPDGTMVNPFMPYFLYGNLTDEDLQAVVAYLRTVPGTENRIGPSEPPIAAPPEPIPTVDLSQIPSPDPSSENYDSAMRGRYLAVNTGACVECHSPSLTPDVLYGVDISGAFQGGRMFPLAAMGLPSPPFPEVLFSSNLTSHETGLGGQTAEDIIRVLREGVQTSGSTVCPPMPVGPMMAYANITDQDAMDIANYLLSLPPVENAVEDNCAMPGPPPGGGAPEEGAPAEGP